MTRREFLILFNGAANEVSREIVRRLYAGGRQGTKKPQREKNTKLSLFSGWGRKPQGRTKV